MDSCHELTNLAWLVLDGNCCGTALHTTLHYTISSPSSLSLFTLWLYSTFKITSRQFENKLIYDYESNNGKNYEIKTEELDLNSMLKDLSNTEFDNNFNMKNLLDKMEFDFVDIKDREEYGKNLYIDLNMEF